jgi:hypothetical protein
MTLFIALLLLHQGHYGPRMYFFACGLWFLHLKASEA